MEPGYIFFLIDCNNASTYWLVKFQSLKLELKSRKKLNLCYQPSNFQTYHNAMCYKHTKLLAFFLFLVPYRFHQHIKSFIWNCLIIVIAIKLLQIKHVEAPVDHMFSGHNVVDDWVAWQDSRSGWVRDEDNNIKPNWSINGIEVKLTPIFK